MRQAGSWLALAVGTVVGTLALSCGNDQFDVGQSTVTTVRKDGSRRLWVITTTGRIESFANDPQQPEVIGWSPLALQAATTSGLAASTWSSGLVQHERVFYTHDNALVLGALDDDVPLSPSTIDDQTSFAGPVAATMLSGSLRFVGAASTLNPPTVEVYYAVGDSDAYTALWHCKSPKATSVLDPLAAASAGSAACFFAMAAPGGLFVCPASGNGFVTHPKGVTLAGSLAAVASSGANGVGFQAFACDGKGRVWKAEWVGDCAGEPTWTDFGRPGSGVVTSRAALAAVAYYNGTVLNGGPLRVQVTAATEDGKLHAKRYYEESGWGSWTLFAAVPDATGLLGGVHLAPPELGPTPAPPDNPMAYFVAPMSPAADGPPATYAFSSAGPAKVTDYTDPAAGLAPVSDGAPFPGVWTESALAERGGHVVVGSHVVRNAPDGKSLDHGHLAVGYSKDDGRTWSQMLVPQQYKVPKKVQCPADENCKTLQGDPSVAFDSGGTAWLFFHELYERDKCGVSPNIFASQMFIASTDGTNITKVKTTKDWLWEDYSSQLGAKGYLDHPSLAITSDDIQHFVWLKSCDPTDCKGAIPGIYYLNGINGNLPGTPHLVSNDLAPPYIIADKADNLYISWTAGPSGGPPAAPDLFVCRWSDDTGTCVDGIVNATKPVGACAECFNMDGVTINGAVHVRSGGAALAAIGDIPGHLLAAFQAKEGTITTPTCDPNEGPFDIGVIESTNFGHDWSPPIVLTSALEFKNSDQFMPSVTSTEDGSVFVTFYDRSPDPNGTLVRHMVAVRRPGGTWTTYERRQRPTGNGSMSDLSLLPHRCDQSSDVFLGDYQTAIGGRTHAHALRMDAQGTALAPDNALEASVLSSSCPR